MKPGPKKHGGFSWTPLTSLDGLREAKTEKLVARLLALGVDVDKASFLRAAEPLDEARALTATFADIRTLGLSPVQVEWLHALVEVLWERWIPERLSLEAIDDRIHIGYEFQQDEEEEGAVAAAEVWLDAWGSVAALADHRGLRTAHDVEAALAHGHPLGEWLRDVGFAFWSAAEVDGKWLRDLLALSEDVSRRFAADPELTRLARWLEAIGRAGLGEDARVEELRAGWLASNPASGTEFSDWSVIDTMPTGREPGPAEIARAERLLRGAIDTEGLLEKEIAYRALEDLLDESGRDDELEVLFDRWDADPDAKPREDEDDEELDEDGDPDSGQLVREGPKIGRNDPCPCGSGKKHKKCCGSGVPPA